MKRDDSRIELTTNESVVVAANKTMKTMNGSSGDADKDVSLSPAFAFKRRRIRTVATIAMTTVLWFQILLLLAPPSIVGAVEGPGRIIPPPPPPRPNSLSSSNSAASSAAAPSISFGTEIPLTEEEQATKDTAIAEKKKVIPPPPPPRVLPERFSAVQTKEEDKDSIPSNEGASNESTDHGKLKLPPPPPPRSREETIKPPPPKEIRVDSSTTEASQEKEYPTETTDEMASKNEAMIGADTKESLPSSTVEEAPASIARPHQGQHWGTEQTETPHQYQSQPPHESTRSQNQYRQNNRYHTNTNMPRGYHPDMINPPVNHQRQHHHHPQQPRQGARRAGTYAQTQPRPQPSSSSSSVTSTLKGLWGQVERRLDDLANLEGTVAGQAQRLVNTAITTASTASKMSPSTLRSLAQSGAAAAAKATVIPSSANAKLATPFGRKSRPDSTTIAHSTSIPLRPYGQKYEIAREEKERKQKEKDSITSMIYEGSALNELTKSISAKGGATSSPYHPPQPPPPSGGDGNGASEKSESPSDANRNPNANIAGVYGKDSYDQRRGSWDSRSSQIPPSTNPENPGQSFRVQPKDYNPPNTNINNNSRPLVDGNRNPAGYPDNIRNSGMDNRQPRDSRQPLPPNDHSRSSRIPWDTSASSSPKPQGPPGSPNGRQPHTRPAYDPDHDTPAWKRTMVKLIPPVPSLSKLGKLVPRFSFRRRHAYAYDTNLDAWDAVYGEDSKKGGGLFGFFKKSKSESSSSSNSLFRHSPHDASDDQSPLIASMISRSAHGKHASLLRGADMRASNTIGRNKAILDILYMVSVILGVKLLSGFEDVASLPRSFQELTSMILPKAGSIVNELMAGSWALFAFLYAYLFRYTREQLLDRKTDILADSVASSVREESEYAQLYLRLVAAKPMNRDLPDLLASVSKTQVASLVSKARLNAYVWIVLASLTFMTVSAVGPILMAFSSTLTSLAMLQEWRQWPIPWDSLFGASSALMQTLFHTLESHGTQAFRTFIDHPIQFSFHLSMFGSLLLSTLLPGIEERRALAATKKRDEDDDFDEDDAVSSSSESAEEWSRLGTSSASRLSMLSENGSVENALARWRASHFEPLDEPSSFGPALSSLLRLVGYSILAALVAGVPVTVSHFLAGKTPSLSSALSIIRWDSLFDISLIQIFLFGLVYQAIQRVTESVTDASIVKEFQTDLSSIKHEVDESNKNNGDLQVIGAISPAAGVTVRDLWAAHATKRAWAIRGANLQCKNGEILTILGEDGSGKTRLLTTIAEALTFPPQRTATTNKVRGFISVGNLEVSKWNRKMLKRRLGILLSDVRMVADSASLFSGWTMEEILEPVDGLRTSNADSLQRKYTAAEKSAMMLALKITGLYGTLLPRLPSKTSTIFTANEEDLRPTSFKPRSTVLSPGEWSKLMLARVLAQTIYDNDNALASNDKIDNSLVGSVLLLDEPTTMHSEVDEGQLYRDLRLTGAATVITTNKWATGRFADQICVMKNGSIVEMGSHNELLARGPQQSLYAAKWHAMTMQ